MQLTNLKSLFLFGAVAAVLLSSTAAGTVVAIPPTDDAYVHSGRSSTNYGAETTLYVGDENWNDPVICCRSYLKFDLSGIPPGSTIVSARLWLFVWGVGNPATLDVAAHSVSDDTWSEATVTWNTAPGFNAVASDIQAVGFNQWVNWDVTADAQAELGNDLVLSEAMRDTAEYTQGRWAGFDSKESYEEYRPYLEVEYQEGPVDEYEYGDAPEDGMAYPSVGVWGWFPTCVTIAPPGFIQHMNFGAWFGPGFDLEIEGNAGTCPTCFPPYDVDECFADGDAGLIIPEPFTIDAITGWEVVCPGSAGTPLGFTCNTAVWGTDIDIHTHNTMPSQTDGYVNVLIDWDQDGKWGGSSSCPVAAAPEHVLVNFPVPNPFDGPLSALGPPSFLIGPNPGYVWARFSITERPVLLPWTGEGAFEDGETEDYLLWVDQEQVEELDFGDAPDPTYPTLLASNGARHVIGGPYFCDGSGGDAPDTENNGQPTALADGDDLDADGDDEDGVSIPNFNQGQSSNISFNVCGASAGTAGAWVQIWIDWDGSGSWEAGEQVYNAQLTDGAYSVPVVAPGTSVVGLTFARCRISTAGGLPPDGPATDGEVEDHTVTIEPSQDKLDFGDAPDPTYPTLLASNGARHVLAARIYLGNGVDPETEGQPDPQALGDDNDGNDDEDGVIFTSPLMPGAWASVDVNANAQGYIDAWVDFKGDGSWAQPGDQIFASQFVGIGVNYLTFWVPFGANPGRTFARFRFSTGGGLSYDGQASDGEVEDYMVDIEENPAIKWTQLPDASPNGIDIKVSDGIWLADDFECTSYGKITDVHLWGSWKYDEVGEIREVHLSFHSDDPVGPGGSDPDNEYSKPDELLWEGNFVLGQFYHELAVELPDSGEYWWDPVTGELIASGDRQIWRVDVYIDPAEAFIQRGDPCEPVIYWMDVKVQTEGGEFGWKTRRYPEHYMDDAVMHAGELPFIWKELRYPVDHPYAGDSIDMAFVLTEMELKKPVPHLKWSQPPLPIDPLMEPPIYCGWDQPSFTDDPEGYWEVVADDFRCLGPVPVTSVHWWGSYLDWDLPELPADQPVAWNIGFWSNVPANPGGTEPNYSHPDKLLWQIKVPADRVQVEWVGMDEFPDRPPESCFQYYVKLEADEYFWQNHYETADTPDNIFWISIAAIYNPDTSRLFPWGWKTRPWHWMDDAIVFEHWGPLDVGTTIDPAMMAPIEDALVCDRLESYDVAFELDTEPNYIKWEQAFEGLSHWAHYEDVLSMAHMLPDGTLDIRALAADDWKCERTLPVTAVVWWGSYMGYQYQPCSCLTLPAPVKPDYFWLGIWTDVPAGAGGVATFSHPNDLIWEYKSRDYDEQLVGFDKHPWGVPGAREPVFRYSVRLPQDEWFFQEDVNNIYWLSIVAVYEPDTDPLYDWGWTNHEHYFNDDAVTGVLDTGGPAPIWTWQELYDQTGASEDMSFTLFTEGCMCKGDITDSNALGPPDGIVDLGDFNKYLMVLAAAAPSYSIVPVPPGLKCADVSDSNGIGPPDGKLDLGDFNVFLMYLAGFAPSYSGPCMP